MVSITRVNKTRQWKLDRNLRWRIQSHFESECGIKRDRVEDCVIAEDRQGLFAVADGVGGHRGGVEASRIVCNAMLEAFRNFEAQSEPSDTDVKTAFERAVQAAIDEMTCRALQAPELDRMATTLAIGLVADGRLFYAHAGDSRIYLLRDGELVRLTEDHSFLQLLRRSDRLSEAELENTPYRNAITRCIGPASHDTRLDISSLWLRPQDRLMFLTDGITDVVDDEALEGLAVMAKERERLCDSLVSMAQLCGSTDDASCVVVDCEIEAADEYSEDYPGFVEYEWRP